MPKVFLVVATHGVELEPIFARDFFSRVSPRLPGGQPCDLFADPN